MATLAVQKILEAGLTATYSAAAAAGDTFLNDSEGKTFLHVKNAIATAALVLTVVPSSATRDVPGYGSMDKATISVAMAADTEEFIGPFPFAAFGANPDVQTDDEAGVTIAVLKA